MFKKKLIVMIMFYFGAVSPYFDLWRRSAEMNTDFTFYLYTDMELDLTGSPNVVLKKTTWEDMKKRVHQKLGPHVVLNKPYKLCDYRTAYGLIFEEDIRDFDFWGIGDLDVIYGNLNHFISQEMLEQYDKLYYHGPFQLFRNSEKMRYLFKQHYPNIQDCEYAFSTNYICHFDETGTTAWASEYDDSIKMYFNPDFYDPLFSSYRLKKWDPEKKWDPDKECYVVWSGRLLTQYWDRGNRSKEVMYVHLMRRKMIDRITPGNRDFAIIRNQFVDVDAVQEMLDRPDVEEEKAWNRDKKKRRKKDIVSNILSGALRDRAYTYIHKIKKK